MPLKLRGHTVATPLTAKEPSAEEQPLDRWPEHFLAEPLPIIGQGTVSLTLKTSDPFRIVLSDERRTSQGAKGKVIVLDVGKDGACFRNANDDSEQSVIPSTGGGPQAAVEAGVACAYWLSLDTMNRRLRYGKGEFLPQLKLMEAELPAPEKGQPDPYGYIRLLRYIAVAGSPAPRPTDAVIWPLPVTQGLPGIVLSPEAITLDEIAKNEATVPANLPPSAQVLYGNVAGAGIALDTDDFPDFARAIDHSIDTEGLWCWTKLREKTGEFGDFEETYLRITLGPNEGDSPGSPYVVEIWPAGHRSPIHNHGQACAVIKVLHGTINAMLFPQLGEKYTDCFAELSLAQGQVTFLSPQFYQIHQLHNLQPAPGNMTATIQCYRYPDDDTRHYEYFDYLDDKGEIQHFKPNSDCEFETFKAILKKEWDEYRKQGKQATP